MRAEKKRKEEEEKDEQCVLEKCIHLQETEEKYMQNKFISSRNGKEPKEYEKEESILKTELTPLRNK